MSTMTRSDRLNLCKDRLSVVKIEDSNIGKIVQVTRPNYKQLLRSHFLHAKQLEPFLTEEDSETVCNDLEELKAAVGRLKGQNKVADAKVKFNETDVKVRQCLKTAHEQINKLKSRSSSSKGTEYAESPQALVDSLKSSELTDRISECFEEMESQLRILEGAGVATGPLAAVLDDRRQMWMQTAAEINSVINQFKEVPGMTRDFAGKSESVKKWITASETSRKILQTTNDQVEPQTLCVFLFPFMCLEGCMYCKQTIKEKI